MTITTLSGNRPIPHQLAKTILIVDDELGPRESLYQVLNPNYKVVMANNGREGLDLFDSVAPDMVISDIRMPTMNGIELMKEIHARSPDTPFVLITGYGTLETAQEALRCGAADYISKPYNIEQIRQLVRKTLTAREKRQNLTNLFGDLQNLNQQLTQQIKDLEKKASIGEISAQLIHDLNNPFCAMLGSLELLEDSLVHNADNPTPDQKEYLEIIRKQIERCTKLTRRFLGYAKNATVDWAQEDLNHIIDDTLFVLRPRIAAGRIQVETRLEEQLPCFWVQSAAIQQVLYNLMANAIEAMESRPYDGQLTVTTALRQSKMPSGEVSAWVDLRIADNGAGIPPEIQKQLFTPFFTTKPSGKGTGLGLMICKRVTQEHEGVLTFETIPGQGTVFTVSLPLRSVPPSGSGTAAQK